MNAALKNTLWVLAFLLACGLAYAVRLEMVHRQSGEWRLRPSAEPVILRYHGHLYNRDGQAARDALYRKHGQDEGGGTILAPTSGTLPETIQVHELDSYWDYRLAG